MIHILWITLLQAIDHFAPFIAGIGVALIIVELVQLVRYYPLTAPTPRIQRNKRMYMDIVKDTRYLSLE